MELPESTSPATIFLVPVFIVELSEPTSPATIFLTSAVVFTASLSLSKAAAAASRLAPESPTPSSELVVSSAELVEDPEVAAGIPPNPALLIIQSSKPSSAIALGSGILSPTGMPVAVVFPTIRGLVLPLSE